MAAIITARIEGGKAEVSRSLRCLLTKPKRIPDRESCGGVGTRWPGSGIHGCWATASQPAVQPGEPWQRAGSSRLSAEGAEEAAAAAGQPDCDREDTQSNWTA